MQLTLNTDGPIDVVTVGENRIDAAVAVDFKDQFRMLTAPGAGPVVLDLSAVTFLDSSGLGAVVAARKQLGSERRLDLASLQSPVAKVMKLTRMDSVFAIHDSVDAAYAAHQPPAA